MAAAWLLAVTRKEASAPVVAVRAQLTERRGGTRMEMRLAFEPREDMEKFETMGVVEGTQQPVSQMDGLLAA